jgi:phosphatidylethanolamine/phosphatidyl-N-methylethanolamine N-methyltransferase
VSHLTSPANVTAPRKPRSRVVSRLEDEVRVQAAELVGKVADARIRARTVAIKLEDDVRKTAGDFKRSVGRFQDDAKFLKNWIDSPMKLGAVMPSSPFLARMMAAQVDMSLEGPVIEIGPGTGPVTEALVAHGIAEERLVLVEFNPDFCELLRRRFPAARVIEGDAYHLDATLAGQLGQPAAAIVSSLPLTTKPVRERLDLIQRAFSLMQPGAPFIQFTYAVKSPVPPKLANVSARSSDWVLRNIPPARVWTYRRIGNGA